MRIGHGYDVHQLAENRDLIIGGVTIPYELGLVGHSDADVLLHAISDALLGSVAEGDIGKHFPDTDEAYKDADSKQLLAEVAGIVRAKGYAISNVDSVVIAQKPKLAPYIAEMCQVIAHVLNLSEDQVNVKATTTEKLGFTGRGEGIAAEAICLVEKRTTEE
ncbi:2-C-methyl-D-erythritol 2,4-cyclodiphosphate synthase [Sporolactobacillus inulinus]|jgi:2-C-methyl-D-erythritol 2,4-cyclodiphosphate synthase|uniref:2-C-methyl-D-erythritol 2,4-cyclodiphosphate synthase n=2 Tax=Sporolactobacillus inulinus TaxID=2078 RepID=A0A4Y1ZF06_9BACL|nr:2-C-methyl-D-erythritol 2,4-cyclodiphosphate synthase [Sporolactobacillus inulinus]KLI02491.1 2-C-methyl-D-erythritol 2,4-cyclodiphosphate synthase [Sporolactobacillus inulinus CASD]GAY77772.1 2-C-methyl-d-erythritol 2,4-cyclodiphosphate synthase [Sporolactobacillus inulinus]GEB77079.1 2-C-methyl-D-erythritol 2,4-cyclodiphosphate synthase [Sporolactobacillus inulinus]